MEVAGPLGLEFPPETGLILRCTRKARNPFQRKQGNRLSCRDQEGRRGSDEVVPGPLAINKDFGIQSTKAGTVREPQCAGAERLGASK